MTSVATNTGDFFPEISTQVVSKVFPCQYPTLVSCPCHQVLVFVVEWLANSNYPLPVLPDSTYVQCLISCWYYRCSSDLRSAIRDGSKPNRPFNFPTRDVISAKVPTLYLFLSILKFLICVLVGGMLFLCLFNSAVGFSYYGPKFVYLSRCSSKPFI